MKKIILHLITTVAMSACTPSEESVILAESVGQTFISAAVSGEAQSLAGSTKTPGIVRVGLSLATKLDELGPTLNQDCSTQVNAGDVAYPLGTGEGTHHIYLTCMGSAVIGIRLRYDGWADQFHILGFWTP